MSCWGRWRRALDELRWLAADVVLVALAVLLAPVALVLWAAWRLRRRFS